MKKIIFLTSLLISGHGLAKNTDALCVGATGSAFAVGDGSAANPYLICNRKQFNRLGSELGLLSSHFKLGKDLDFDRFSFVPVGSKEHPFQGEFNGNGYKLSSITLSIPPGMDYIAPFPVTLNANIANLNIAGVVLLGFGTQYIGGLVSVAENSTFSHIHITGIQITAPDYSGGLVGVLKNSTITDSSTEGVMSQHFGTDASGGLVGQSIGGTISKCSSKVKLVQTTTDPFGVSSIGGLIGYARNTNISNVYAQGDIDYSIAIDAYGPREIGGLIGTITGSSTLVFAYYAGKIAITAEALGGVVGASRLASIAPVDPTVFWDIQLSGVSESPLGEGHDTATLKTESFWTSRGFDPTIWILTDGGYPTLILPS